MILKDKKDKNLHKEKYENMTAAKQSQAEQNMKSSDGQDMPPKPLKIQDKDKDKKDKNKK